MAIKITSEYLIAYFDILGYKKIVQNLPESEETKLITNINKIIKNLLKLKKVQAEIIPTKVYTFSDNFLLAMEINDNVDLNINFSYFIMVLQQIQYEIIMYHGLYIRGGIVKGPLYTGTHSVHGKGLITAYEIEDTIAVYPRIVVDKNLLGELLGYDDMSVIDKAKKEVFNQIFADFGVTCIRESINDRSLTEKENLLNLSSNIKLEKDSDSNYFVNYLQQIEMDRYRLGYKDSLDVSLAFLGLYIIRVLINLYNNRNNNRIAEKYLWCCTHYSNFCKENGYPCNINEDELKKNYKKVKYIVKLILHTEILIKCTKNDITQFDIATQSIFKTILEEFTKFPPVLSVLGPYTASNASVP